MCSPPLIERREGPGLRQSCFKAACHEKRDLSSFRKEDSRGKRGGRGVVSGEDFPKTTRAKLEAGRLKLLDELALLFGQRLWELDVDFDV